MILTHLFLQKLQHFRAQILREYNTIQYILNWPLPIGAFQVQSETINETTEHNNNNC